MKTITTIEQRNRFDGSLIYKDNDFEKTTGRTKFLKDREKNDKKLWFIKNNKIKKKYREKRNCPSCDSSKFDLLFKKDGFDHVICKNCNFVFVSPVLTDKALFKFYKNEKRWTKIMLNNEEKRINKIMYNLTLDFLEKETKSKTLLDIGSGSGYFLEIAKQRNWKLKGIEFNKKLIKLSKKNGLDVDSSSLEELYKNKEKFDVITSWYVLEHIKDIKSYISNIKKLLKKDGLLFIAVPQLDSLVIRLYGKESPTFAGYSHINFFNKDSLNKFITSYGFELIAQETQITQLNNIKKFFSKFGLDKNSGINNFLNDLTPEYIHENMLGSNLVSVYRKKDENEQ